MHWAAHGNTAAEIIYQRIDAGKHNLGLTHFTGKVPSRQEKEIAKNYLSEGEMIVLNRLVSAYLELAEIQALNRQPMYMKDWIERLDDFIKMTGNDILQHAGTVSHAQGIKKANDEYEKYKEQRKDEISDVEKDFIKQIEMTTGKLKSKRIKKS